MRYSQPTWVSLLFNSLVSCKNIEFQWKMYVEISLIQIQIKISHPADTPPFLNTFIAVEHYSHNNILSGMGQYFNTWFRNCQDGPFLSSNLFPSIWLQDIIYVIKNSPSDEQASFLIWQLQLLILVSEPHLDPATTTLNKYASLVIFGDQSTVTMQLFFAQLMISCYQQDIPVGCVPPAWQSYVFRWSPLDASTRGVVRSHVWYFGGRSTHVPMHHG